MSEVVLVLLWLTAAFSDVEATKPHMQVGTSAGSGLDVFLQKPASLGKHESAKEHGHNIVNFTITLSITASVLLLRNLGFGSPHHQVNFQKLLFLETIETVL